MTASPSAPDQPSPMDLIYFGDPMCSWCYGFVPSLERLRERFGDQLPVRPVMGGLRAGNQDPMDEAQRTSIRGHWDHVAERSGQPFDFGFFDRQGFVYDTAPACLGVVTARGLGDDDRAIAFMHRLSHAFYALNIDITAPEEIVRLAGEAGHDPSEFANTYASEPAWNALVDDLKLTQQAGVRGFPTLVGRKGEQFWLVSGGYQSPDDLLQAVETWLEEVAQA